MIVCCLLVFVVVGYIVVGMRGDGLEGEGGEGGGALEMVVVVVGSFGGVFFGCGR